MQKLLSILFLVIFLTSTSGVIVEMHHCSMKKCKTEQAEKKNCCHHKKKADDCCKNEKKFVKLTDNYRTSEFNHLPSVFFIPLAYIISDISAIFPSQEEATIINTDISPPKNSSSLSFLQIFRI